MFGFLDMLGNYPQRRVERYEAQTEAGRILISTAFVTDGAKPYETAVGHPDYNDGKYVIVQAYDTVEEARTQHFQWVRQMTNEPLPTCLIDCGNGMFGSPGEQYPRTYDVAG